MEKHITLVAALNIAFGVMGVLGAAIVFVVVAGSGFLSGDLQAMAVTTMVGSAVAFFLVLVSVPGIIGGIGLLKHRQWARILLLIIAVLNLINVPLGTLLGAYALWVLLNKETVELFTAPAVR